MKKLILLAVVTVIVCLFFIFGLDKYLTLSGLKESLTHLTTFRDQHPVLIGAIFFVFYIAVTALSLPGATIMTLAGGALFGLGWGALLVSFASSLGATLAFLVSRYLLRNSIEERFGERLKTINDGMAREGAFYLFTLRLIPIFPFFLINLVMGLTKMKAITFYWVSQLGMLAGTLVYVNAGTQLAKIDSLKGIASPTLIFSFALLGIFPLIAKRFIGALQAQKIYKNQKNLTAI
jgi:uncharacterized membrane protein YdjX (TVP38/TMEM64 family)